MPKGHTYHVERLTTLHEPVDADIPFAASVRAWLDIHPGGYRFPNDVESYKQSPELALRAVLEAMAEPQPDGRYRVLDCDTDRLMGGRGRLHEFVVEPEVAYNITDARDVEHQELEATAPDEPDDYNGVPRIDGAEVDPQR